MNVSAAVRADLDLLSEALDEAGSDIAPTLRRLIGSARAAVVSYQGMMITVSVGGAPFTVTSMSSAGVPDPVGSSLRIPVTARGPDQVVAPASLTLYAARTGAFVDLAADLSWLTGLGTDQLRLDEDIEGPDPPADLAVTTPLQIASTINQAIGVLIGQGHPPEAADIELDARAAAAGADRHAMASTILDGAHADAQSGRD